MAAFLILFVLLLVAAFLPYIILNLREKAAARAAAERAAAEAAARKRTVRCPKCKQEQEIQADIRDWDCTACGSPVLRDGNIARKGKRKAGRSAAR